MKKTLKVVKRDGSTEEYSEDKVRRVVKAAGLKDEETAVFSQQITSWVMALADNSLTSLQIRDMILEKLPEFNAVAADLYRWYESTKEESKK